MAIPAETLLDLCLGLQDAGVELWIDGGWGVDALLGEQTRAHQALPEVRPTAAESILRPDLTAAGCGPSGP